MKNLDSPGKWRCFNTSPYSLADSCRILINNLTGPVKKPPELPWLEQDKTWPAPATKTLSCLFLGDFLSIQDVDITFDSTLHTLADDSDFIIVNLEGNIGPAGQWSLFHQHNALEKFLAITRLKPANKIIVSLANNHTADYGEEGIRQTRSLLERHGFVVTGLKENTAVELVPAVWLHAFSLWSNQPTCAVAALPDAKPVPGAFNILYPHWGYELELQPRPQQVLQAETLLQQWDMIVGHHAHVPQPITTHTVGGKEKLLAYSLGDFACQFRRSHYRHGCVLRAELGKTRHGETVITRTQWYFSFADFTGRNKLLIRLNKHCPYFRQD